VRVFEKKIVGKILCSERGVDGENCIMRSFVFCKIYHIIPKMKCRIAMAKTGFSKKKTILVSKLGLNLRNKLVKWYVWSMVCVVLKLGHFGK